MDLYARSLWPNTMLIRLDEQRNVKHIKTSDVFSSPQLLQVNYLIFRNFTSQLLNKAISKIQLNKFIFKKFKKHKSSLPNYFEIKFCKP